MNDAQEYVTGKMDEYEEVTILTAQQVVPDKRFVHWRDAVQRASDKALDEWWAEARTTAAVLLFPPTRLDCQDEHGHTIYWSGIVIK